MSRGCYKILTNSIWYALTVALHKYFKFYINVYNDVCKNSYFIFIM